MLLFIAVASIVAVVRDDNATVRGLGVVNLVVCGVNLLIGVVASVVIVAVCASTARRRVWLRTLRIGGGLMFALPVLLLVLYTLLLVGTSWLGALLSVPTTLLGLWTFRRMQRNRKTPWWLVLVAFLWGVSVSAYFASIVEGISHVVIEHEVLPGLAAIIGHAAAAAFPEEFAKGAGVVVIVLLARHRIDGMLGGIVIGAAVGLGFQFAESLNYMADGVDTILYQHWYRQVTGLLISHATYTGIIGAGVGLATQQTGWWRRAVCVVGGFLTAVAAHLVWDIWAMGRYYWESDEAVIQLFLVQPLNLLVLKGPGFVLLLGLVLFGLRLETKELYRQLTAEAASHLGAVTREEVRLLLDSPRRFRMRMYALWWDSFAAYLRVRRLHAAQLDLAFVGLQGRYGIDLPSGTEDLLRQRIGRLKAEAR